MWLQPLVYSNKPLPRTGRHLVFWLAFVVYRLIEYMPLAELYPNRSEFFLVLRNGVFHLPVIGLLVYAGIYFILPRYLAASRYRAAILASAILFLTAFGLNYFIESFMSLYFYPVPISVPEHLRNTETTTIALMVPFYLTAIAFRMTKDHILRQQENRQLLIENLQAGFRLTKARLQPVILLEALNEIQADIAGDYAHAPEMILTLSNLLHYILYETDRPRVALSEEIKMIEDYVALKSIRHKKTMMTDFVISGNPAGKTIPPLLCLPVIDMLFRRNGPAQSVSRISVAWWLQGGRAALSLTCMHNRNQATLTAIEDAILEATRNSLEINYPGKFVFEVEEGKERLDIFMEINTPIAEYA